MANKVLLIGLDGATWNLIEPLAEQGKLPTFKMLMKEGVWGGLQSTLPPVTGPAWVSFATGKNPGKHGIFDFLLPKQRLDKTQTITTEDIRSETFYEMLCRQGFNCILINLPVSFPPRIEGIVITSLLTKGDNYIFPQALVEEIPELSNYRLCPDTSLILEGRNTEYIRDIIAVERKRVECAKRLFQEKEWDFFFLMFGGMDSCQHRVYDKLEPYVRSRKGILDDDVEMAIKLFEGLDGFVKWFAENIPQGTNILLMSDHGACSFKGQFFLNAWLEEKGYLKTELNSKYEQPPIHKLANDLRTAQSLRRSTKWQIRAPSFLLKYIKYISPSSGILHESVSVIYRLLRRISPIQITTPSRLPNVDESVAIDISHSSRAIYLNTKDRFVNGTVEAGKQYQQIRSRIITELKELRSPRTGEKVLKDALKREDVYWGPFVTLAPDIILVPDRYFINVVAHSGTVFNDEAIANDHALEGILLAYGPAIKQGLRITDAKIYDIAPTILHMFGLPVPKDMDGRVLKEIFEEGSELARREITYQEAEAEHEKERMKQKIKELKAFGRI